MMPRLGTMATVLAGMALVAVGCRSEPEPCVPIVCTPKPVIDFAGTSLAGRIEDTSRLCVGRGAESRLGDYCIENAFVRFVVAAPDRTVAGLGGGNLIDAAAQGGEDRMRMLLPMLGGQPRRAPCYDRVRVAAPGGTVGEPAKLVASGTLAGRGEVAVETVYLLRPDSASLEVRTTVRNDGERMLALFDLEDVLYTGRTLTYAPGTGPCAAGTKAAAPWFAMSWRGLAWGLLGPTGSARLARHYVGFSEFHYGTVDIAPGASRSFVRHVMAAAGGPEAVWRERYQEGAEALSTVRLHVHRERDQRPVRDARFMVKPQAEGSPFMLWTTPDGCASMCVAPGDYELTGYVPGCAPIGPLVVKTGPGMSHELEVGVPSACLALSRARCRIAEYATPATIRLAVRNPDGSMPLLSGQPAFPASACLPVVYTRGIERVPLALAPGQNGQPKGYLLVGSHGPLFDATVAQVVAIEGKTSETDASLTRVIDPGEYVSVDFRVHTDRSPDCALTLEERALTVAGEGLVGAVVSDPKPVASGTGAFHDCLLMPAERSLDGDLGASTTLPMGRLASPSDAEAASAPGGDEFVQVDRPLDPDRGYFAVRGMTPQTPEWWAQEAGSPPQFDALEILTGDRVDEAERLLPAWFALLDSGYPTIATGGSGSRGAIIDVPGRSRTFLRCPAIGGRPLPEELRTAIGRLRETPDAFVTNGPFLDVELDGYPVGSTHQPAGPVVRMRIRVRAAPWVDVTSVTVYSNGAPVREIEVPVSADVVRFDQTVDLDAPQDAWFVVCVRGERPMEIVYGGTDPAPQPWALTNPFWIDADGDGEVTLAP